MIFFRILSCFFVLGSLSLGQNPLPKCRYDELLSYHNALSDWHRTLLDGIYKLTPDYAPTDLVSVQEAGFTSDKEVRSLLIADLKALNEAARAQNLHLEVQSAYRSYSYQEATFQSWVAKLGLEAALLSSARAGHSEHQLGTALDFRTAHGPAAWDLEDWALSPEGSWLADHAWQFGFVMSYPQGKTEITCYIYEPWHYRYIGKDAAKALKDSGLTLREWLWQQQ